MCYIFTGKLYDIINEHIFMLVFFKSHINIKAISTESDCNK